MFAWGELWTIAASYCHLWKVEFTDSTFHKSHLPDCHTRLLAHYQQHAVVPKVSHIVQAHDFICPPYCATRVRAQLDFWLIPLKYLYSPSTLPKERCMYGLQWFNLLSLCHPRKNGMLWWISIQSFFPVAFLCTWILQMPHNLLSWITDIMYSASDDKPTHLERQVYHAVLM